MRSVVVVLPASTWAMMPILRISERGVVRAIARFRKSVRDGPRRAGVKTAYSDTTRRLYVERKARPEGRGPPPGLLSHAVAAALEAGRLRPKVIGSLAGRRCRRPAGSDRIRFGPRPSDGTRTYPSPAVPGSGRSWDKRSTPSAGDLVAPQPDPAAQRRTHRFILADDAVPAVVGVVRIVVRNAVPPQVE